MNGSLVGQDFSDEIIAAWGISAILIAAFTIYAWRTYQKAKRDKPYNDR
ncbi:MAG: hypothetical protein ACWA5L_10155 [bacterium]